MNKQARFIDQIAMSGESAVAKLMDKAKTIRAMAPGAARDALHSELVNERHTTNKMFQAAAEHAVGKPHQNEAMQHMLKYRTGSLDALAHSTPMAFKKGQI